MHDPCGHDGHHDHDHHGHSHGHHHQHGHRHHTGQHHEHDWCRHGSTPGHAHGSTLVIRPYTGISGDIMVAGLARMLRADQAVINEAVASLGMPELEGSVTIVPHSLNEVGGWRCAISLPHEHSHRSLADIRTIIEKSALTERAKALSLSAFTILAEAEGAVHGKEVDTVTFHDVGALDSILDTCLAAALFDALNPALFVCGPLPVCDGAVRCAHGTLPVPAPAVMRLLHGVPVKGIVSSGETLTPTGIALLKAFGASFGNWPGMTIAEEALIYGTRVFENVPNGAIFAFGEAV